MELSAPAELDDRWDVGDPLMVFFEDEVVVGWYLPDKQFGVNFGASGRHVTRTYRCRSCGATWVSYPAGEAIEEAGRCLRCDGTLVLQGADSEDNRVLEDDAEG